MGFDAKGKCVPKTACSIEPPITMFAGNWLRVDGSPADRVQSARGAATVFGQRL